MIGLAVLSGVAAASTLAAGGPTSMTALTKGFATAFLVATGVALASALLAVALRPVAGQRTDVLRVVRAASADDGPPRSSPNRG